MKPRSNQDAPGWIAVVLSCLAFVACGAREGTRVDLAPGYANASDFKSVRPPVDTFATTNVDDASAFDLKTSELSGRSTRRLRLSPGSAREFQTLVDRSTYQRVDARLFLVRPFWTSIFPRRPLFISFLTLRN